MGPVSVTITNDGSSDIVVTSRSATGEFLAPGGGTCSAPPFTLTPGNSCIERFSFSSATETNYVEGDGLITYTYQGNTHTLYIDLEGQCF